MKHNNRGDRLFNMLFLGCNLPKDSEYGVKVMSASCYGDSVLMKTECGNKSVGVKLKQGSTCSMYKVSIKVTVYVYSRKISTNIEVPTDSSKYYEYLAGISDYDNCPYEEFDKYRVNICDEIFGLIRYCMEEM